MAILLIDPRIFFLLSKETQRMYESRYDVMFNKQHTERSIPDVR